MIRKKLNYINPEVDSDGTNEVSINLKAFFEELETVNLGNITDRKFILNYWFEPEDDDFDTPPEYYIYKKPFDEETPNPNEIEFEVSEEDVEIGIQIVSAEAHKGVFKIQFFNEFKVNNLIRNNFSETVEIEFSGKGEIFVGTAPKVAIGLNDNIIISANEWDSNLISFDVEYNDPGHYSVEEYLTFQINGTGWMNVTEPFQIDLNDYKRLVKEGKNLLKLVPVFVIVEEDGDEPIVIHGEESTVIVEMETLKHFSVAINSIDSTGFVNVTHVEGFNFIFTPETTVSIRFASETNNNGVFEVESYDSATGDLTLSGTFVDEESTNAILKMETFKEFSVAINSIEFTGLVNITHVEGFEGILTPETMVSINSASETDNNGVFEVVSYDSATGNLILSGTFVTEDPTNAILKIA